VIPLSHLLRAGNLERRDAELRDALIKRQFQRIGREYHPDWAMHQAAINLGLGAPLSDQERIEMGETDYVAQSFGADVLYSPVGDWGIVKRLSELR
jgi:N-acetylmuramoyl-L-alanine amidase